MRFALKLCAATAVFLAAQSGPVQADPNHRILSQMVGSWFGEGQLEYTKIFTFPFKCEIQGQPGAVKAQVDLTGRCWYGPLWGRMAAALRYDKRTGSYRGIFRDATETFIIDLKGKRKGQTVKMDLQQGPQRAAMDVAFENANQLQLTIDLIDPATQGKRQVIDLTLNRLAERTAALDIKPQPKEYSQP